MATLSTGKFVGAVQDEWDMFSDCPEDYSIGSPIGFGASSIVYAAVYNPPHPQRPIPCALKVLDLDTLHPRSLSLLQRETQLMSLSKHPNVLRVRGSWMDGCKLHIALRLMNKGSAADVMHYSWPGGMEEDVVRCILKQALEGLNYLHINGFIHRDIKAANLLIDDDGTVLVGDLGVAASLVDDGDTYSVLATSSDSRKTGPGSSSAKTRTVRPRMGKRKSFVGTPCWMAPELIEGKQYDAKADIWSFGITAIELTQGRPPRSRESPHSVLLQTVQGRPPTLDREGGVHRYSQAFKDVVDACLRKEPSKRPTSAELLQMPFFKGAKKKSYLVGVILAGLPPLAMRQERRKRPPSLMAQRTMDSWDFSLSAVRS
ncbi:kinase-like domain-containing protein, partial [Scleroderma citrinum]